MLALNCHSRLGGDDDKHVFVILILEKRSIRLD